jgi:formate/nitrite transporter FocA (FNT family)
MGKDTKQQAEQVDDRTRLRAPVIYQVISEEGRAEMHRPINSLFWSGLAAGLSLSFSLLAQAILLIHLPDTPWRPLVSDAGYTVGFLIVILGRQQLFTENTITVVLPLLAEFNRRNLFLTGRIWSVVLGANIVGTAIAAIFCTYSQALSDELRHAMIELSAKGLTHEWWEMLFRGISAGFVIAALVWIIPSAEGTEVHVILIMTYLIAAGGFTHIVAGNVEGFMLVLNGQWTWLHLITHFELPVLIGNSIGGTALFAVLSYAQVMDEM